VTQQRDDGSAGGARTRAIRLLGVAPGPAGVADVWAALPDALAGLGPALGLAPTGDEEHAVRARATVVGLGPDDVAAGDGDGGHPASDLAYGPAGDGAARVDADVAVVMATSGSTGRPRGVLLTAAGLLASAHAAYSRLGGPGAWLLALPVTGVGGLQVLVRSLVAHVEPLVLSSVGGAGPFSPAEFATATWRLDPSLPAYTSIVPTQAARLLDDPDGLAALRAYEAVLLGGARTPPALLERLLDAQVAAITTYGMTETSGGMFYDGTGLPGVGARIVDPDPTGLGRIALTGPTLARGYLGDPALTGATFVDGLLLTGDLGRLTDDGHGVAVLEVVGRADDVVQVGGVNVAVSAVADLLAGVCADACVLAAPDEVWGHRLTAYVVTADSSANDDALAARVRDVLGPAAVPRAWVHLDALPHLPNGKPDRDALRRLG
jgi:O-succinylbenzoic acid--CoA ligase